MYAVIIGSRLQERIIFCETSQKALARKVGLHQSTINGMIHGDQRSSTKLHQIARALRTTPAYLTGETDDPDGDGPDEPTLTSDEAELLELFRAIEPKERAAFMVLVRSIATNARSPTVNEKGLSYRGPGAAKR